MMTMKMMMTSRCLFTSLFCHSLKKISHPNADRRQLILCVFFSQKAPKFTTKMSNSSNTTGANGKDKVLLSPGLEIE